MGDPFIERPGDADVRVASNSNPVTEQAIRRLLAELDAERAALTLVFYGSNHDDHVLARELDKATGARGVAGTSSGELNSAGFARGTMSGISFHGDGVRAAVEIIPQLRQLSLIPVVHLPTKLIMSIDRQPQELDPKRHLWLFLLTGASGKEDLLTPFFMSAAPRVNLVGATLGFDGSTQKARLIHQGRVYKDAAATLLLEYDGDFEAFHHTHVVMTEQRLEVTRTGRNGRLIQRLDGKPALQAYSQALGLDPADVDRTVFARHPLGYRFRGQPFPISVANSLPDGTLVVGSTVQHGQTLALLEAKDLVESSRACLEHVISRVSPHEQDPAAMLLFHCTMRDIEARQSGQLDALAEALSQAPLCGLNCRGEQFATMHMNHSMTGVVFGPAGR